MTAFSYITHRAIEALQPGSEFKVDNDDLDTIVWLNGTTPIAKDQIVTKQSELQTAYDAKAYARARETAYPSVADFMEAYTEKEIGSDSTKWDAYVIAYNKVRTDNPK